MNIYLSNISTTNLSATDYGTLRPLTKKVVYQQTYAQFSVAKTSLDAEVTAGRLNYHLSDVSVKDFGAVGDGVTDDTVAIQTGIDFLRTVTIGGTLIFPKPMVCYRTTGRLLVGQRWVHEDLVVYAYNLDLTMTTGYDATKLSNVATEPVVSLVGEDGAEIWGDFTGGGTETAILYFGAGGGLNKGTRPKIENLSFVGQAGYSAGSPTFPSGTTSVATGQMGLFLGSAGRVEVKRCRFRELNRGVVSTSSDWSRITHNEVNHANRGFELMVHNAATVTDNLVQSILGYGLLVTGQNTRIRGFDTENAITDIWVPSCDNLSIDGAYLEGQGATFNGYHIVFGDTGNPGGTQGVWGRISNVHGSKEYGGNYYIHSSQVMAENTRIYPNLAGSARLLLDGSGTQFITNNVSLGTLNGSSTFSILDMIGGAATVGTPGYVTAAEQYFTGIKHFTDEIREASLIRTPEITSTGAVLALTGSPTDGSTAVGAAIGASTTLADTGSATVAFYNGYDVAPHKQAYFGADDDVLHLVGGGYNTTHIAFGTYHIWVDTGGNLRIKNGAPANDTDGTVVGTQS